MALPSAELKNQKRLLWLSFTLLWLIVIFAFSHQSNSGAMTEPVLKEANVPVRKLAHMTEFGVLYLLLRKSLTCPGETWIAFLLVICCAALDEWHQSFVPGRSAVLSDVLIDGAGALVAMAVLFILRRSGLSGR